MVFKNWAFFETLFEKTVCLVVTRKFCLLYDGFYPCFTALQLCTLKAFLTSEISFQVIQYSTPQKISVLLIFSQIRALTAWTYYPTILKSLLRQCAAVSVNDYSTWFLFSVRLSSLNVLQMKLVLFGFLPKYRKRKYSLTKPVLFMIRTRCYPVGFVSYSFLLWLWSKFSCFLGTSI